MAITILRSESGDEVSPALAGIGTAHGGSANYIVGQYNDDGTRVRRGVNAGGIVANDEARRRMERLMMNKGGERTNILTQPPGTQMIQAPPVQVAQPAPIEKRASKAKRGKKAKAESPPLQYSWPADNTPLPPYAQAEHIVQPTPMAIAPAVKNKVVVFNTGFGTIKTVVDAVLETETGLALVFANDSEVRFTPEQGNELTLGLQDGRQVKVMYLGLLFQWYNTTQQVMTFIKSE